MSNKVKYNICFFAGLLMWVMIYLSLGSIFFSGNSIGSIVFYIVCFYISYKLGYIWNGFLLDYYFPKKDKEEVEND